MSAAESPFSVKRWLASHSFRRFRVLHVTLSDTTPSILWDQHDWPFHLGLYGPASEILAMQHRLTMQFLAQHVAVFFIGPAEHPQGFVELQSTVQSVRFINVEPGDTSTPTAATDLAVSLRPWLIPVQPALPLQAAVLFSATLPLSFTRQLACPPTHPARRDVRLRSCRAA